MKQGTSPLRHKTIGAAPLLGSRPCFQTRYLPSTRIRRVKDPSPGTFRESEDCRLDDPREIYAMVERKVEALNPLAGTTVFLRVFFRPEEHRSSSEGIDDAGLVERYHVHHRDEHPHAALLVGDPVSQVAVDGNLDGVSTVLAFAPDDERERPFYQLPLHEGQRQGVDGSGRIDLLARAERHVVRRRFCGHRVGPGNLTTLIPE